MDRKKLTERLHRQQAQKAAGVRVASGATQRVEQWREQKRHERAVQRAQMTDAEIHDEAIASMTGKPQARYTAKPKAKAMAKPKASSRWLPPATPESIAKQIFDEIGIPEDQRPTVLGMIR